MDASANELLPSVLIWIAVTLSVATIAGVYAVVRLLLLFQALNRELRELRAEHRDVTFHLAVLSEAVSGLARTLSSKSRVNQSD